MLWLLTKNWLKQEGNTLAQTLGPSEQGQAPGLVPCDSGICLPPCAASGSG